MRPFPISVLAGSAGVVAAGALLAVLAVCTSSLVPAGSAPGPTSLDVLLGLTAVGAAWCVAGWLLVGLLLSFVAELRGRGSAWDRMAAAVAPRAVRRLAAGVLGATLLAGSTAAAAPAATSAGITAAVASTTDDLRERAGTTPLLPGWTPDRPAPGGRGPTPATVDLLVSRSHLERSPDAAVVVRRGDTLWDIAARALGPSASAAEVAASWPRWYAANRAVIGPDPHLILPGQVLQHPARA